MPYIFALSAAFGAGCIAAAFWIPRRSVHRHFARGFARHDDDDMSDTHASSLGMLVKNRSLMVLAVALAAFNIGNSAMLPLYSLAASASHWADPSHITAANIIISQIVMLIAAAYASRLIRRFGFWPLILATLFTLPLRAVTAAFVAPSWGIVPVQVFDGIGAGLQSVAVPALVVHLLHGSGRVNLGQGAVQGVEAAGACVSPVLGGWIAQHYGYPAAFLALGSLAVVSVSIWLLYGQQLRGTYDSRRDELVKLEDLDSSSLFP
jgi:MFS family permease